MFDLGWDAKLSNLCYQSNGIALFVLLADNVSVDDDFLTSLITTYSSCSSSLVNQEHVGMVMDWIIHWTGCLLTMLGWLYLRLAQDLCILLLTEYHSNVGY